MKEFLKKLLSWLPFPVTKNQAYDHQTLAVMKRVLGTDSNCVDVGCHEGDVFKWMLHFAPEGIHHGFEPIPHMAKDLEKKFPASNCHIHQLGLSNDSGVTTFNYVRSNPAYSGFKKREYARAKEEVEQIEVQRAKMDDTIPPGEKIDFIKIDVEGGEYEVLLGAKKIIKNSHPIIVFEHGLGAADKYGTTPEMIYDFLVGDCGMQINLMKRWLNGEAPFTKASFSKQFNEGINYYFIASFDNKMK